MELVSKSKALGKLCENCKVAFCFSLRGHGRLNMGNPMVPKRSDKILFFEHRRRRQHQVCTARGVGHKCIRNNREFTSAQRLSSSLAIRQHRNRIPIVNPSHPHWRIGCFSKLFCKKGLRNRPWCNIETADEAVIECAEATVVKRNSASRDSHIATDCSKRINGSNDGAAIGAALHAPANLDGGRTRSKTLSQVVQCIHGKTRRRKPLLCRSAMNQRVVLRPRIAPLGCIFMHKMKVKKTTRKGSRQKLIGPCAGLKKRVGPTI